MKPLARLLALAVSLCACREAVDSTQIVVVVDADDTVRETLAALDITTSYDSEEVDFFKPDASTLQAFPLSFSLVPHSGNAGGLLKLRGYDGAGRVAIERDVRFTFRSNRWLTFGVFLSAPCLHRPCAQAAQTCGNCGVCQANAAGPLTAVHSEDEALSLFQRPMCKAPSDAGSDAGALSPADGGDAGR